MVSPARFERATYGLGGRRSVLLSYGDLRKDNLSTASTPCQPGALLSVQAGLVRRRAGRASIPSCARKPRAGGKAWPQTWDRDKGIEIAGVRAPVRPALDHTLQNRAAPAQQAELRDQLGLSLGLSAVAAGTALTLAEESAHQTVDAAGSGAHSQGPIPLFGWRCKRRY